MKLIQVTHHDMDGAGSAIVMKKLFKDHLGLGKVERHSVGYSETNQLILNILSTVQDEDVFLIITDLRIETKFLSLLLRMEKIKKFLYVDHHERADGRTGLESLKYLHKERFLYRWRKTYCATELCFQLAKEHGMPSTPEFDKLMARVDAYDMWHEEDKHFQEAFGLNELFWELGFNPFIEQFYDGLIWTDELKAIVKEKIDEQNLYFKEGKDHIMEIDLANDRKLLMSFNPKGKFGNLYTLRYEADLFLIFAYVKDDFYKFSLRGRNPYFDTNLIAETMGSFIEHASGGGHAQAAGLQIPAKHDFEFIFEQFMACLASLYKI